MSLYFEISYLPIEKQIENICYKIDELEQAKSSDNQHKIIGDEGDSQLSASADVEPSMDGGTSNSNEVCENCGFEKDNHTKGQKGILWCNQNKSSDTYNTKFKPKKKGEE